MIVNHQDSQPKRPNCALANLKGGEQEVRRVGEQESSRTFRVSVFIVNVVRHGPEQVQLYLLGGWGEGQARVVVGEKGLVVLLLVCVRQLVAPHSVHDDRPPHGATEVDGDAAPDERLGLPGDEKVAGPGQSNHHVLPAGLHLLRGQLGLGQVLLRDPLEPLCLLYKTGAAVKPEAKPAVNV